MIRGLLHKDVKLLWPLILLVTLIQACLQWAWYRYGAFGDDLAAGQLLRPLTFAWFVGTCGLTLAIVLQDAVPALDQDWLIRPISRLDLLISKLSLTVGAVLMPMFVLDVARALATGFALGPSLEEAAIKEALVAGWLLLPVAAIAATAATFAELLVLGAALIAVYAGGTLAAAVALGTATCPTCGTGTVWIEHTMQHAAVLTGACVILGLQYFWRRTQLSRALALIGALAIAWFHLPWSAAFALESRLSPEPGAGRKISVAFASRAVGGTTRGASRVETARPGGGWRTLLEHRASASAAPVRLDVPVTVSGLGSDEIVFVDATHVRLSDREGHTLYAGANGGMFGSDSLARPGALTDQAVLLPALIYRRIRGRAVRLELEYSLTLLRRMGRYRLAANAGSLQASEVGRCATRIDASGLTIKLRCRQVGPAPSCVSATLVGPDGRRDPELWDCDPDYRPDLPGYTDVLRFYSLDVPARDPLGVAPYPVAPAGLTHSYLIVCVYGSRDHFRRALVLPDIRPEAWH